MKNIHFHRHVLLEIWAHNTLDICFIVFHVNNSVR